MAKKNMLDHTARMLPLQDSATSPQNDYATPQVDLCSKAVEAETHVAEQTFSQIQGGGEKLVVHHAKGGSRKHSDNDSY